MTGEPIPPDDMRMIYQKANYFWHSDSSFKRVPSLCSILTARICPPEGGNTEFLYMRAAWDALPPALQATIHPLVAEHALAHSRDRVQKGILSAKALAELPPVKQRLFRDNPINGRRALYIGAHAGHIVDWPEPIGKALLYELSLARRPAGVPAVARLARGRRDRLGQSRRPAPRDLLRCREVQALHAAHDHRRRRADRAAIRDGRTAPRSQSNLSSLPTACRAGWPRRLAVATITIGLTMSVLSNSMTNLALPYIAHDLGITAESSIWIVNASQIALMVSLLPVAALADIVGYRHVYRVGLALFSLASLGCVLAPVAALADRGAHLPGAGRRGASWRSSRRWCAPSIRATCWAAAWASTPPWWRPRWPPARRSARRCCRSGRGRSCSPSTSRSASSPSS